MRLSEATEALHRIGLSQYEAVVFLNLARAGVATAGEIARASGVNRVQTYRALESLEGRGFVEVTLERPKRYAARAADEVFDMVAEEKRAELEALEAVRKGVRAAWPVATGKAQDPPSVRLQVIKGGAQIYKTMRRFVGGAKKEVLAFTTTKGVQRAYRAGVNEVVVAATSRGVEAKLIADINEANRALMARVARHVALRHADKARGRLIIVDRESILAFLIQDEQTIRGDRETALWTNSPDFVQAHVELFEQTWKRAVPAAGRLAGLKPN